jgi:hypothetical protein
MRYSRHQALKFGALFAALLAASAPAWALAATRNIDQHQAADPKGTVEIINVAGSVQVSAWDKPEVSVTGQIGDRVERVDLTSSGNHTTLRVVLPSGSNWGGDGAAHLVVHVPMGSGLDVSLVSADLEVSGVSGTQQIRGVSGSIQCAGAAQTRVNTVSGAVHVTTASESPAEIETVSGDVSVEGAGGDVSVQTVSGDGRLALGSVGKLRLRTVSGDFVVTARLAPAASFEGESVSGDLNIGLKDNPGAEYDLQSLSGGIGSCNGHEPEHSKYGPGSRLTFTVGDGKARVHMSSKSGDLSVCAK